MLETGFWILDGKNVHKEIFEVLNEIFDLYLIRSRFPAFSISNLLQQDHLP
jgi:hypothetical protein